MSIISLEAVFIYISEESIVLDPQCMTTGCDEEREELRCMNRNDDVIVAV
jgi:hypothetical protein